MKLEDYPPGIIDRVMKHRGRHHSFETLDPVRTALLVVDMQNAFMSEGSPFAVAAARDVVPTINRLAHGVREAGGRVVWVISTYGPDAADYWPVLFEHVMGPDVAAAFRAGLTKGAEGHAIWRGLEVGPDEPIVDKNRFSGFIGSNGRLERLLRQGGIDAVLVTGTVTNVCCESTAREAAMLNFKTIMVSDGNGGRSAEEDLETYSVFLKAFGDVMTCDDVLERLARAPSPHAKETV